MAGMSGQGALCLGAVKHGVFEALASLSKPAEQFDLIETMAFDPRNGMPLLDLHMARLHRSAADLRFSFDRHGLRNELQAATFSLLEPARVRVLLGKGGEVAIEVRAHRGWPQPIMHVAIQPRPVWGNDFRLRYKTTDRQFYQQALKKGGTFEVVLVDDEGFVTEGCFSSVFVERDGKLLTPPLSRGLLAGVLRQNLIDQGEAVEADLTPQDLEGGFFIGNAARGLVAASVVAPRG
jgi:4-amino-4-deoxychorismate lyase/para-aminobenzoate synthetase/4-amino-4-deoxychorismate lyase